MNNHDAIPKRINSFTLYNCNDTAMDLVYTNSLSNCESIVFPVSFCDVLCDMKCFQVSFFVFVVFFEFPFFF